MPLSPSTITSRASAAVGATRAMRRAAPLTARARTNSAPVRVLPKPRPAEQQPDAPLACGRQLVGSRPETPIVQDRNCLNRGQRADQLIPQDCRERAEPAGVQARHVRPPPDRLRGCSRAANGAVRNMPRCRLDRPERVLGLGQMRVNSNERAFDGDAGHARRNPVARWDLPRCSAPYFRDGGSAQILRVQRGGIAAAFCAVRRDAATMCQPRPLHAQFRHGDDLISDRSGFVNSNCDLRNRQDDCQNALPVRRARRREFRMRLPG